MSIMRARNGEKTYGLEQSQGVCAALGRRSDVRIECDRTRRERELPRRDRHGRHGRERNGAHALERRRRKVIADRAVLVLVVVVVVYAERERRVRDVDLGGCRGGRGKAAGLGRAHGRRVRECGCGRRCELERRWSREGSRAAAVSWQRRNTGIRNRRGKHGESRQRVDDEHVLKWARMQG
jgi:hypothetical protein